MEVLRESRRSSPFRLNSFRLEGLDNLDACYRLVKFTGPLEDDEDYEKKVRLLAILLASELRKSELQLPVEPVRVQERYFLAIAGPHDRLSEIIVPEHIPLNPEVATLKLIDESNPLRFQAGNGFISKVARRALIWAIQGALSSPNSKWWRYGRRFVRRTLDETASNESIAVHPAFYYGVVPGPDGTFELVIDPSVCYSSQEKDFGSGHSPAVSGRSEPSPGGATDHSPGRQPWEPPSPSQPSPGGATEQWVQTGCPGSGDPDLQKKVLVHQPTPFSEGLYVEQRSLYQKFGRDIPASVKGRRFLYRYGEQWYKIDALGVAGSANKELMTDPDTGQPISIYDWIKKRWRDQGIELTESLCPDAPTIAYKTAAKKSRRAHPELLFGLPGPKSDEDGEATPHSEAIQGPDIRGRRTEEFVRAISDSLKLYGKKLQPRERMRVVPPNEMKQFPAPSLRFAGDQVVKTKLETAGRDRFDKLRRLGPAESTPFYDQQLILLPESMPEQMRDDFKRRFCLQVQELYGEPYDPVPIKYDDTQARTLREHARAIGEALADRRGYALLVLPTKADRRLHDYLKRHYWEQVQTQCASVDKILRFYRRIGQHNKVEWVVRVGKERWYRSYLRFLALGYLMVNCKWLWKLAENTLHHDVHVGIDVYKGIAVFTFIYGDADRITFHVSKSKRPEKLFANQVEQALVENLGPDLAQLGLDPTSIVFHRDGKIYDSELRGIRGAISSLQSPQLAVLSKDVEVGVVEIHKTSSTRPRIYRRWQKRFANPKMGTCVKLGKYEAALATTGEPLLRRGTARPLYLEVVKGRLDVMELARDIYALSHLAFTSPGSCMRLPFTIALADHILRESTPGEEEELWDDNKIQQHDAQFPLFSAVRQGGL